MANPYHGWTLAECEAERAKLLTALRSDYISGGAGDVNFSKSIRSVGDIRCQLDEIGYALYLLSPDQYPLADIVRTSAERIGVSRTTWPDSLITV